MMAVRTVLAVLVLFVAGATANDRMFTFRVNDYSPPMSYPHPDTGILVGSEVELIHAICAAAGAKCVTIPLTFDHCFKSDYAGASILGGYLDGCCATTMNQKRMNALQFVRTGPGSQATLVTRKDSSLSWPFSKTVKVLTRETAWYNFDNMKMAFPDANIEKVDCTADTETACLEDLKNQKDGAEVLITPNTNFLDTNEFKYLDENVKFESPGSPASGPGWGCGMRKDNIEAISMLTTGLQRVMDSGEYDAIVKRKTIHGMDNYAMYGWFGPYTDE